jgi:ParB family chromosome partitioning protein
VSERQRHIQKPLNQKTKILKDLKSSLEEKLIKSLGTKVRILHKGKKGGKIEIEYYSLEELDRLLEIFTG